MQKLAVINKYGQHVKKS